MERPLTTPAPYGAACNNCARAKCKCMLRAGSGSCERLNKECQPSISVRKRVNKKAPSRTAQLEEKLDDLVTLLRSSHAARSGFVHDGADEPSFNKAASTLEALAEVSASLSPSRGSDSRHLNGSFVQDPVHSVDPAHLPTPTATQQPASYASSVATSPADDITVFEAEECLHCFRSGKLKFYPFVYIPETMSAAELRSERPFLWMSMLSVATKSVSRQIALGLAVRQYIAQKILVEQERSLDLLLGLLVIIGLPNFQMSKKPFLNMWVQIAVGMVTDLYIHRNPLEEAERNAFSSCFKSHSFQKSQQQLMLAPRTLEDRRTILAVYLVSAGISTYMRKVETMRWTPYMDECLNILWDAQESPLDRSLVLQVKLQLVTDEAVKIGWNVETSDLRILHVMQAKILRSRFNDIKAQIPAELQSDIALQGLVQATEISICSMGIWSTTPTPPSSLPDTQRVANLSACLQGIKAWLSIFLSVPPSKYIFFSFAIFAQLSHNLMSLYRLSTLEDQDWDREAVRREVNALEILDQIIDNLSRVPQEAGLICDTTDGDSFTNAIKAIKYMRSNWESVFSLPTVGIVTPAVDNLDEVMGQELNMDFPDGFSGWLTDGWSWDV